LKKFTDLKEQFRGKKKEGTIHWGGPKSERREKTKRGFKGRNVLVPVKSSVQKSKESEKKVQREGGRYRSNRIVHH